MVSNRIRAFPFSIQKFAQLVCPRKVRRGEQVPDQVDYLARYAQSLGVKTIVEEGHYIDRHYIDEYALYYSRMLSPPPNCVRRLHFFGAQFDDSQLASALNQGLASSAARAKVESQLSGSAGAGDGYLGFCCVRPIESAPIGRTLVARLADGAGAPRCIWATGRHDVHLANLRLGIEALAFQQQDAAVGACATAALWSAMERVARHDGARAPTPAEISEAATIRSRGPLRSILPVNHGMTVAELTDATRAFGYTPEVLSAHARPELFVLALHTYLQSGIPVVLALRGDDAGHAVTAAGFQLSSEHPDLHSAVNLRSAGVRKIYVHDDRLGPYARAYIEPFKMPTSGNFIEGLRFEIEFGGGASENWLLDCAVVPMYPKVRLNVSSMLQLAVLHSGSMEGVVGSTLAKDLRVDLRYQRSGDFLAGLSGRVAASPASTFLQRVALSRWCAVIRWSLGATSVAELVFDTTDVVRDAEAQSRELLRGIVACDPRHVTALQSVGRALGVPIT